MDVKAIRSTPIAISIVAISIISERGVIVTTKKEDEAAVTVITHLKF